MKCPFWDDVTQKYISWRLQVRIFRLLTESYRDQQYSVSALILHTPPILMT